MWQIIIQLLVLALALAAAGLKSLRFAPSALTDFELQRQLKAGDEHAERELGLRQSRPLLDALRRLAVLVLLVVIVAILASGYPFVVAIILALIWLLLVELLSAKQVLDKTAERLARQYQPQLLQAIDALRPALQLIADSRILGGNSAVTTYYSKDELQQAITHDTTVLDHDEKSLLVAALNYQDKFVRDIMTPRSVVVTVESSDTIGPLLLDKLHKTGHSRYPVTDGDLNHVQGILYTHDLVPLERKAKKVTDVMSRKVFYVQQDQQLDHVLRAFLRTKHHLFMVVNEFEEVMGVVTIEDVLEAIIGRKIVDEFDQYDDMRAVAKLAASARKRARDT